MKKIGIFEFKLLNDYVDFTGYATMKTIADMALNSATENAKENEYGIDDLISKGMTWVLARLSIDMDTLPKFNDTVEVETWISSVEDQITERKFRFLKNGEQIGVASSMWAILDLNTRKAIDLSIVPLLQQGVVDREYEIEDTERVRCLDSVEIETRKVRYSDLDINNHVNSIQYIEWIFDAIDLGQHQNDPFYGLLINYQYEVHYGNTVSIRKSQKREHHYDIFDGNGNNTTKIKLITNKKQLNN